MHSLLCKTLLINLSFVPFLFYLNALLINLSFVPLLFYRLGFAVVDHAHSICLKDAIDNNKAVFNIRSCLDGLCCFVPSS